MRWTVRREQPEWIRDGILKMVREDGVPEAKIEVRADALIAGVKSVTVWSRAVDRRKPDGTASVDFTAGSSSDAKELDRLVRRIAGKAGGRPPRSTTIEDPDPAPRADTRDATATHAHHAVKRGTVLGDYPGDDPGFLKREQVSWSEFLASF